MGWFYSDKWQTKQDICAELLRDCNFSNDKGSNRVLKHSLVGNHLWVAIEIIRDGARSGIVALFLLSKDKRSYGYKDMTEDMHPFYYDCPLSIIKAAGPTLNLQAREWRAKVAEAHEMKKKKRAVVSHIKKGDLLTFEGNAGTYRVDTIVPKPMGYRVDIAEDNNYYKLPMRRLKTVVRPDDANLN